MSEIKNHVFLQDNKIIVNTDNGTLYSNGDKEVTIKSNKLYIIEGDELIKIMALINGCPYRALGRCFCDTEYVFSSKEEALKELSDKFEEYDNKCNKSYEDLLSKYKQLQSKIDNFNMSRRFYERTFKYE